MIDKYAVIASKLFHIPVSECKLYARDEEKFVYFWDPNDKYGSVIVDKTNGSWLSANKNVTYIALKNAFDKGGRSE